MRISGIFVSAFVCFALANSAFAGAVAKYDYQIDDFVQSPTQPIVYGTVPSLDSVVVINTNNLQVTNTIPIGSDPEGIAISPDGSTLYIADSGSTNVAVLSTSTLSTLTPITSPGGSPTAVQIGSSGRIWIQDATGIHQLNASTGASAGPDLATTGSMYPLIENGGNILVTPNGNTLFYGNYGLSPSNAYQYNVSGTTPVEDWIFGGGGNGDALVMNHAGTVVAYSSGGDSNLSLLNITTGATLGTEGQRGNALAFNNNDSIIYTGIDFTDSINAWSTSTFKQIGGSIDTESEPEDLFTDNSGKYLFAGELGETQVFAIPEPASLSILFCGGIALLARRRKHSLNKNRLRNANGAR